MGMVNRLSGKSETSQEKEVGRATGGRRKGRAGFGAVLAALVFALVVGSITLVPAGRAAFPGTNGKIAFFSGRDGDYEIYTMNADGTNPTRLTSSLGEDSWPEWSPDGTGVGPLP